MADLFGFLFVVFGFLLLRLRLLGFLLVWFFFLFLIDTRNIRPNRRELNLGLLE